MYLCADDTRIILYGQCGQLTMNYLAVYISHKRLERVCHPPYNATLESPTLSSSVLRSRARRDAFRDSTCRVMLGKGTCEHIIHVVELVQARLDHKGSVHLLCEAKQGLTAHQSIPSRLTKGSKPHPTLGRPANLLHGQRLANVNEALSPFSRDITSDLTLMAISPAPSDSICARSMLLTLFVQRVLRKFDFEAL